MEQFEDMLGELSALVQQDQMLALIRALEFSDKVFMRLDGLALISHLSMNLPALYKAAMKFCSACGICCSTECVALRSEVNDGKETNRCDIYSQEGVPLGLDEVHILKGPKITEPERLQKLGEVAKGRSRPDACRVYIPLHSVHNEVRDPSGFDQLDPEMARMLNIRQVACIFNFRNAAREAGVQTSSPRLRNFLNGGSK